MKYSSIIMFCEWMLYNKVTQLHILFHYVWSQYVDYSSLRYAVGPCYLPLLCLPVCICWPRTLNIVPCAIQLDLVYQFASADPGHWILSPVLYSWTLFICSLHTSFHLLVPNPNPTFFHPTFPWQPPAYSLCLWFYFCFIDRFIHVIF